MTLVSAAALAALASMQLSGGPAQVAQAAETNPIVLENSRPGTTAWRIGQGGARVADDANGQIKGYASRTSVDKGESIQFKVSVAPVQEYTIAIYRMGCYPNAAGACLGGRFMTELGPFAGTSQPACPLDGPAGTNTGLIECDWSGPSYTIPTGWTSGVYLAVLTNDANYQNYVSFVVRDDARQAALLYQQPVMNYQAYNPYPWYGDGDARNGKSLYDNKSGGADTIAGAGRPRAVKVSFDRPYAGDGAGELLDENGWSWEGYFIRWIEQHGYDVAYSTSLDTHQHPERLLDHHGWLSVGHDEYWTTQMYDAAEAARDAGIHLGFFGANDIYWQARLEPSSHGQTDRTMVVYKNSPNNTFTTNDPIADPALKTVRFQDPPVNRPAQTLLGQSFQSSTGRSTLNTDFKVTSSDHWAYEGSGFTDGAEVPGIVGYETDQYSCHYPMPEHTSYTMLGSSPFRDADGYVAPSNASIYRAPSGAWVFDAGTMSWSWALDRPGYEDPRVQKTTQNLLDVISGQRTPTAPATSFVPDCSDHRNLTFEDGSLTTDPGPGATGGDRTIGGVELETAAPIGGAFSLSVPNVGGAYLDTHLTPTDDTDVVARLRLRALPPADVRVLQLSSLVNASGNLLLRASGVLCLRNANAWVGGIPGNSCTAQPLQVGTDYRIRIHQVRGTGNDGVLEGFVAQGTSAFGAPFVRTSTGTWTTKVDRLSLGTTTAAVLDAVIDDVAVDGASLEPPSAPTGLSAVPSTSATLVDLSWTDTTENESSMVVERSTSSDFSDPTVITLPRDTTSYRDTGVTEATTYWYRVKAANAGGQSDGVSATVTTRLPPPAAPTNLTTTWPSATRTVLHWTDNASTETSFVIERADNASFRNAVAITLPPDTTSYDDGPVPEGPYFYRVNADNGLSSSSYTNVARGSRIKDLTFEDGATDLVDPDTGATRNAGGLVLQDATSSLRGRFSARVPDAANAYLEQTLAGSDDFYASFYLRLASRPAADQRIAQVLNGSTTIANLWIRSSTGQLCLKYGNAWSGGVVGTGCTAITSPLQDGRLYRIALRQQRGDGTSSAVVQGFWSGNDAGVPAGQTGALRQFTSTSLPPSDPGYWQTQPSAFRIGATLSTTTLDATFDNVKLDAGFMPSDDLLRPSSSATSSPYSTSSTFPVTYTTEDRTGAGVARVDLYAKGPGDLGFSKVDSVSSPGVTGSFTFLASQDGAYSFYTVATDGAGFSETTTAAQATTVVDTVLPSSAATAPATSSGGVDVGYTVSDTGTGTARVDLYAKGPGEAGYSKVASHSDGAGSGTFTYTADHGDGSYAFYTVALDTAGNEEAAPATADASTLVDGAAPTSQATADPVAAGSPVTVDFTASDAASGIARVDLYARAPGETDYAKVASRNGLESGSFSYEVFAGDGTYRFYTRAVDGAGNVEDAPAGPDATVAVDTLAPDSSASAPARSRTTTLSVDYATSDEGTGLAQIDLYARAPGQSAYTKVAGRSGSPTSGSFTYTAAAGDGTYRFYTIATDAAGHVETAPGAPDATIDVDTGVPASSASAPATSYAVTVPVSWTASDPGGGTGLATLELYVRVPGQTAYQRAATITDPAGSGSLAYSPSAGDGVYRFYTVATDRAGNAEAAPATPDATTTVAVDTVAPASAAGTLALYTTGSPFPPIAYTASDSGPSGLASLELWVRAPGAASYALSATNAAPGASGSFTFVPTIDGLYRFYTVAVDRAGNREAAPGIADASTTLDRAAPTAFQLQSPANSAGYVRATATMALTTAPTDADSGVASVRYQFAPTGTTTWTDACSATAAPWSCNWNTTVVVERSYSVRALATDRAGNTTVASNAPLTVIVDNTRPVAQAIAATNRTGGTAGRPEAGDSVTFTFSERVAPASVLTGWSGASTVVQLRFINGGGGIDRAEVWRADGTARLAVANPLTLNGDYVTGSGATFNATMVQSNATVVVTLGTLGTGSLRSGSVTGGTIVWTPGATLTDLAGNLVTTATPSRTGTAF